jgi:glycosyltransferase involved in cell wall biosynthesis
MEAYARKEGLKSNFLGWLSDPWSEISSGDILVCTSRYEGMPLVILEALSREVPVIAKEIPGVTDIFTDFKPLLLYRDIKEVYSLNLDLQNYSELKLFNREVLNSGLYDSTSRASQLYLGLL